MLVMTLGGDEDERRHAADYFTKAFLLYYIPPAQATVLFSLFELISCDTGWGSRSAERQRVVAESRLTDHFQASRV